MSKTINKTYRDKWTWEETRTLDYHTTEKALKMQRHDHFWALMREIKQIDNFIMVSPKERHDDDTDYLQSYCYFVNKDGNGLCISLVSTHLIYDFKLEVTGHLARDCNDRFIDSHSPKISMSADKSADKIKKDIQKRLMPDILRIVENGKKRQDSALSYHNGMVETYKALTGKTPPNYKGDRLHVYSEDFKGFKTKEVYKIEIRDKDCIYLENYFTLEQFKEILKVLEKFPNKKEEENNEE